MNRRAYAPDEVAFAYGMPVQTVWKRIRQGQIRAINVGTDKRPVYRIPAGELDKFDQANTA